MWNLIILIEHLVYYNRQRCRLENTRSKNKEENKMNKKGLSALLTVAIMSACTFAAAGEKQLQIFIKGSDVDMEHRTINFKINKDASVAELKVTDLDGNVLSEKIETFDGAEAGKRLAITWPVIIGDARNFIIDLKVTDVNDYWVGFQIAHFYGDIPHEEVIFESGKWDIRKSEAPKLDDVIPKIIEMVGKFQRFSSKMSYGLYVAGHTDTVGSTSDNRTLSMKRARSIAQYLIKHGLKRQKISIYVRGFGEESPAVKTADNVAEAKNRRADYIISNFPPPMHGPGNWKPVQKK